MWLKVRVPHPHTLQLAMIVSITKFGLWCTAAWGRKLLPLLMLDAQLFLCYPGLRILPLAANAGADVTHNVTQGEWRQWLWLVRQIWARRYRVSCPKQWIMIE